MPSQVWLNGQLIPSESAQIPFLTHGLHYGSAVFEGIRVYQGIIFQLDEHIQRLLESAAIMDMDPEYSHAALCDAAKKVVITSGLIEGYVRPLIWRGSKTLRIAAPDGDICSAIAAWQVATTMPSLEEFYNKTPLRLTIAKWRRPAPDSAPYAAKASRLYVISTLAAHEAKAKGFDDAMMLDYRGLLAEGTSNNIFLVINGELHTPTPDCFLDGLTRQTVIKLAKKAGLVVRERHIALSELADASEAFLTGTTCEIAPLGCIDSHQWSTGPVTKHVMTLFYEFVMKTVS